MIVGIIAVFVAGYIIFCAVDETMMGLEREGATDDELIAALGRFLRVIGGSALLSVALVAMYTGRGA